MAKIDCSNIFNFVSEWERRDKVELDNYYKPSFMGGSTYPVEISMERAVNELQKWSDEHPRHTRKEKFIQMCMDNGFEEMVTDMKDCGIPWLIDCGAPECEECKAYWNEEVME